MCFHFTTNFPFPSPCSSSVLPQNLSGPLEGCNTERCSSSRRSRCSSNYSTDRSVALWEQRIEWKRIQCHCRAVAIANGWRTGRCEWSHVLDSLSWMLASLVECSASVTPEFPSACLLLGRRIPFVVVSVGIDCSAVETHLLAHCRT